MSGVERLVLEDPAALARHAAELLVERLADAPSPVAVCLSGGSTPRLLYELLATPPYRDRIPWDRVHWFWGDERFVPPDHEDSNYRMARLALFAAVPAPPHHVHPIPTQGMPPFQAALAYELALQGFYGAPVLDPGRPLFAVTLLGLGEDGHTASLFPGVAALDEARRWTAAVIGAKPEPRISLTLPALAASRDTLFLVAGAAKRPVLERLARGEDLPAGRVRAIGTVHWLLDRAAAGEE